MKKWMRLCKPGGVTISEALQKELPIFVHSALPGQEEVNLRYLKVKSSYLNLILNDSLEEQLFNTLNHDKKMGRWYEAIECYHKGIEIAESQKIVEVMESLLHHKRKVIHPAFIEWT